MEEQHFFEVRPFGLNLRKYLIQIIFINFPHSRDFGNIIIVNGIKFYLRERQEQLKKDNEAIREEIEQITAGAQSGSSEIEVQMMVRGKATLVAALPRIPMLRPMKNWINSPIF